MTAEPAVDKPRRRDSAATRAAILQAARRRFASQPFEQVGLREVAADAGVDAALIARYFGSKEELFREIVSECKDVDEVWAGERSEFGKRVAEEIAQESFGEGFEDLLIALRATASPRASELSSEACRSQILRPLAQWLGGADADVRARLLMMHFMGGVVSLALAPMDEPERTEFLRRLADSVQRIVDGE